MDYQDFLRAKIVRAPETGFEASNLPPALFDWQRAIVEWCCRKGRAAIFADCGLGKTLMQLAWADQVCRHTGGSVLILTPLAVGPQTVAEAERFGLRAWLAVTQEDVRRDGIYVTNYQKLLAGHFTPEAFAGVVLDESSILKSYMGKTKQMLCSQFAQTPYRLACTATPAPNDHTELGNHSQFLGVMDSDEMLGRWFINDQGKTGNYRLKGHAEADYWRWLTSWAVCVGKPSDLGYSDDGYELPPINYHQHVVSVDATADAGDTLFRADRLTATTLHREMRRTAAARAAKVAELVNAGRSSKPWVVWCNTNYEADAIRPLIPGIVEVRGSDADSKKEAALEAFADGRIRVLLSKPSICGFGLNWQHCHNLAFVGLSYSQEQFYQAVRRSWRFGQKMPVNVHVVIAETEGEVLASLRRKEAEQEEMRTRMRGAMHQSITSGSDRPQLTTSGHEIATSQLPRGSWKLHLGDCVEVAKTLPSESVDLTVFSPPFSGLYIYSDALADMGNSADDAEFFRHFGFLAPELLRLTVPGRLCVVHCKDLPRYAGRDGTAGLKDFPGETIRLFESAGWSYHSRVTIWKCPVLERERTNNNGLLHKTLKRDTSQVRQGMADYLIVFRRPPRDEDGLLSDKPIERPDGLQDYTGDNDPRGGTPGMRPHPSPYARSPSNDPALAVWQRYAEPVWWDIQQTDTLNERLARESGDEKHICPLQLGLIRRVVQLWSLPGETVFSPFAGIGSEGYVSLLEGRRFVGIELKRAYWQHACEHLRQAETEAGQVGLFDSLDVA